MAELTLNTKHIIRNDTATAWSSANPVLAKGELGYASDGQFKIGDGTTSWNSLNNAVPNPNIYKDEQIDYSNIVFSETKTIPLLKISGTQYVDSTASDSILSFTRNVTVAPYSTLSLGVANTNNITQLSLNGTQVNINITGGGSPVNYYFGQSSFRPASKTIELGSSDTPWKTLYTKEISDTDSLNFKISSTHGDSGDPINGTIGIVTDGLFLQLAPTVNNGFEGFELGNWEKHWSKLYIRQHSEWSYLQYDNYGVRVFADPDLDKSYSSYEIEINNGGWTKLTFDTESLYSSYDSGYGPISLGKISNPWDTVYTKHISSNEYLDFKVTNPTTSSMTGTVGFSGDSSGYLCFNPISGNFAGFNLGSSAKAWNKIYFSGGLSSDITTLYGRALGNMLLSGTVIETNSTVIPNLILNNFDTITFPFTSSKTIKAIRMSSDEQTTVPSTFQIITTTKVANSSYEYPFNFGRNPSDSSAIGTYFFGGRSGVNYPYYLGTSNFPWKTLFLGNMQITYNADEEAIEFLAE